MKRFSAPALIAACLAVQTAFGAPITPKEIGLMVRMRVPEQEILAEVRKRNLMAPLDDATAEQLKAMGASEALLQALRSSVKALDPEQAAAAQAEETRRREAADRELAEMRAKMAAAPPAGGQPAGDGFAASLAADVFRIDSTGWVSADAAAWSKTRYVLLYFSAGWCGPCRRFTPDLVARYSELKERFPELEIVFVSADRTPADAIKYSTGYNMPWYALAYGDARDRVAQYAASGIPYLALIGPDGTMLRPPGQETAEYIAPATVLEWIASGRWRG